MIFFGGADNQLDTTNLLGVVISLPLYWLGDKIKW
jgi:hypothetical protein